MLKWCEIYDDEGNVMWEAPSPYHDDGVHFRFRLRQELRRNRIVWIECHDAEIANDEQHDTLEAAKQSCERQADAMAANVL